jgi:predicted enzyme related to lactoylglutathione lyase
MLNQARFYTTIPTRDLDRARQFYEQTVGLMPGDMVGDGIMYMLGGAARLFVYVTQAAGSAQHTLASFEVDDIRQVVADLRTRGITFADYDYPTLKTHDGIAELPHAWAAWFTDPDGNILALTQPK